MTEELLPCPFCASHDVELRESITDAHVACNNCGCRTGFVFLGASDPSKANKLIEVAEVWNTRPSTPLAVSDEALVEKLVGWQPIETAPHGRPVLLAWQDWRDGKWIMDVGPASTGERNEVASSISHHGSATQWMPLPAPPALP